LISKVPFHRVTAAALVAGSSEIRVRPSSGQFGAISGMYDSFELYKVSKLRFRLLPNTSMATAQSVAYYPESQITAPTVALNTDVIESTYINNDTTVPTRWVNVPATRLQGQLEWYKSVPDAGDVGFEDQGIILVAGTSTETYYLEIQGTILFKNPVSTSVVMDRIRNQLRNEFQQSLNQNILPSRLALLTSTKKTE
jgi:hypothetical protein